MYVNEKGALSSGCIEEFVEGTLQDFMIIGPAGRYSLSSKRLN